MKNLLFLFFGGLFFACSSSTVEPSDEFQKENAAFSSSEESLVVLSSSSLEEVVSSSSEENLVAVLEAVKEGEFYTTWDSVAAYLCKFDKLPGNYVNKSEGIELYESKTGNEFSKWNFNPWITLQVMIGGDSFQNRERLLPEGVYFEADVDYFGDNRGTKRLVYAEDCVIYWTKDHYVSFDLLEF